MIQESVLVRPGELGVESEAGTLVTLGLGSCVVVVLYDAHVRVGGMTHAVLPEPPGTAAAPAPGRFVSTAVPLLLDRLTAAGAELRRITARLVGGASMFPALLSADTVPLGTRNITAARAVLQEFGVPVRGEDVGGHYGRSVYLHVADGRLVVKSVYHPELLL